VIVTALKIIIVKYPIDSIFLTKNRKKGSMVGKQEVPYSLEHKLDQIKEPIGILLSVYSLTYYLVIENSNKERVLIKPISKIGCAYFQMPYHGLVAFHC